MDPQANQQGPKKVLVPIADGSEEIEAACIIDTLRRSGAEVTVASVEPGRREVVCSRKLRIVADCLISECKDNSYDMIVLPGVLSFHFLVEIRQLFHQLLAHGFSFMENEIHILFLNDL
jgi:hypothetical protein